jgi:hypothetical protein
MNTFHIQGASFYFTNQPQLEIIMADLAAAKAKLQELMAANAQSLKTLEKVTREYQVALQTVEALTDENAELRASAAAGQIPDDFAARLDAGAKLAQDLDTQTLVLDGMGQDLPPEPAPPAPPAVP